MYRVLLFIVCITRTSIYLFATADDNATPETKTLLFHLKNTLAGDGVLFGHQNDLISGINDNREVIRGSGSWADSKYRADATSAYVYNSDIYRVCGDYAAVHGFDIGRIEMYPHTGNIDWHSFSFMRNAMKDAYGRKGISTVTWHMFNPKTYEVIHNIEYTDSIIHENWVEYTDSIVVSSSAHYSPWVGANDPEVVSPFPEIITEGTALNDTLNAFLTIAGNYFKSLTTKDTIPVPTRNNPDAVLVRDVTVPIIFRPFHELNGGSFWWGLRTCTDEEYVALWQYTFHYLTEVLDVHNLLYCWSPYGKTSEEQYLRRYPGDAYVDILGFEANNMGKEFYYSTNFNTMVDVVYQVAQEKDKPFALCENGIYEPDSARAGLTYFTDYFEWIYNDNEARHISYILFWRNYDIEFKVPYPGHELAPDFKDMYEIPHLAKFESDLKEVVFNYALGPYMLHPDDFPTTFYPTSQDGFKVRYNMGVLDVENRTTEQILEVKVHDINGQLLETYNPHKNTFSKTIDLPDNVYLISVKSNNEHFTSKISVRGR